MTHETRRLFDRIEDSAGSPSPNADTAPMMVLRSTRGVQKWGQLVPGAPCRSPRGTAESWLSSKDACEEAWADLVLVPFAAL